MTSAATSASANSVASTSSVRPPRVLVLRTAGINCERETAHAFSLAGAEPVTLHLHRLAENPQLLEDFQMLAVPGGFSYGDDIAAGRIFADALNRSLSDALRRFVDRGNPTIGICNGFQVLLQTNLLPGHIPGVEDHAYALTDNTNGRFIDRWVTLRKMSPRCVWTRQWGQDESVELPIAHGEGRFVCRSQADRDALSAAGRIALCYSEPSAALQIEETNPNGSDADVAGVCDETGLVLGLMPHPERFVRFYQHPAWTSRRARGEAADAVEPAGLRLFRGAVEYATRRF